MDSVQVAALNVDTPIFDTMVHEQLLERLDKLRNVSMANVGQPGFEQVLREVDAALAKLENGTYGLCETCGEPLGADRLLTDPLARVCLDELTGRQKEALQTDLEFAVEIQRGLLPQPEQKLGRWNVDYFYEPAGIISGDYCDVIAENGQLYFILGDVSGKGVAASLLMSNLHAIFHSLVPLGLELQELVARANRLLVRSSLPNQFATIVVGRADEDGEIETVNAGHLPPMLVKNGVHGELECAGLPLGMFTDAEFPSHKVKLGKGDSLLLFTDGVTEAMNHQGEEFGTARLCEAINGFTFDRPRQLIQKCVEGVTLHRGGSERGDDMSLLAITLQ